MTTDGPAIEVRGLHKAYGGRPAVRGIDLSVARGEVFALLGPNGAGKTTTVEILEGYRSRDSGEVRVLGLDPARGDHDLKTHIGIVLQSTGIDVYLTVAETVDLLGAAYPHRLGTDTALELVGLRSERDHLVRKLSAGQRRRLDVAVALVGDADLLFLDEPTTGFDPSARRTAWDLVKDLARRGKTIFLTTHYMEEAEYLADRVAIIADGRIVAEGPPGELGTRSTSAVSFRLPPGAPALPAELATSTTGSDRVVSLVSDDPTQLLHDLTVWALDHGMRLEALHVSQPSLEDTYSGSPAPPRAPCARHEQRCAPGGPHPIDQPRLLAQSSGGVLHTRPPGDVPGFVLRALRDQGHPGLRALRKLGHVHPGRHRDVLGHRRLLHQPGHRRDLRTRGRVPQAAAGHACPLGST